VLRLERTSVQNQVEIEDIFLAFQLTQNNNLLVGKLWAQSSTRNRSNAGNDD